MEVENYVRIFKLQSWKEAIKKRRMFRMWKI